MMVSISREARLKAVRANIRKAGAEGAEINETTPALGGVRRRDIELLITMGEAEWVDGASRVRLKATLNAGEA